jgi:tetratricopeptide (TPR) repeat protein
MKRYPGYFFAACVLAVFAGCGPSGETARTPAAETPEALYRIGHAYYLERNLDSAAATLTRAYALDSTSVPLLTDLADVYFELGMRFADEKDPRRLTQFRRSRGYLIRLEALGSRESVLYERLCELSVALDDSRSFLKWAKKNAEKYPYDRQAYNLGIALYENGEYAAVVKTMKESVEKFKTSPYIGGYYRQMGLAYMKMDRDQTATKTFETGLIIVDQKLAEARKSGSDPNLPDLRRLADDRVGMLVSLRKIYQTYKETAKLERVERLLREAGYMK